MKAKPHDLQQTNKRTNETDSTINSLRKSETPHNMQVDSIVHTPPADRR